MFSRFCAVASVLLFTTVDALSASRQPNVVFILADDLGYGELGCYGQKKIRTPRIDELASQGTRFTRHYSGSPVCAPSRCVLMTGKHPGHAVVRDNREIKPEGQFSIPDSAVTLAELFRKKGYATGAFGKWGLGGPDSPGRPLNQGFDRFYGYNCQARAHDFYPTTLWDDDRITTLNNHEIPRNARLPQDADPNSSASYRQFSGKDYSADLIAEQALRFVREKKDQPFFLFWPTTVPHLALQVPEDSLNEYVGKWPDPPYPGGHGYLPQFAPRAAYAAMITRMDREVGRMLDLLKELKLEENTIVVFTSDNGPTFNRLGGSDSEFFDSAGGLRGLKGSLYEGGIRVPLIVRWPDKVAAGATSDRITGFEDWMPTLLELVNASAPSDIDGITFAPTLLGKQQTERPFLYREFPNYGGQQSLIAGNRKVIRQNLGPKKKTGDATLELYDLAADPAEEKNIAAEEPETLARLTKIMRRQHTPSKDFPMPVLDAEPAS